MTAAIYKNYEDLNIWEWLTYKIDGNVNLYVSLEDDFIVLSYVGVIKLPSLRLAGRKFESAIKRDRQY